ncbi:MAG: deoxyhypusine synthase [Candidatus Hinthialibacter antarcticus]|nr:deoxyhypusine synthase [Candidatus Hinthialibacter antarcticus]
MKKNKSNYYVKPITPNGVRKNMSARALIDECFSSFNARGLRNACQLFADRVYNENTTIGMSLTGALVPAGLGRSCLIPLIKGGYIDWMISTGANMYHDLHSCLGYDMFEGSPDVDDTKLRKDDVVRIHDIYFEADALFDTDAFIRKLFREYPIEGPVSSAVIHRILGEALLQRNPKAHEFSVLAAAAKMDMPIHTSSPGDSSTGMNLAGLALEGKSIIVDPNLDVNLTAAWVYDAKKSKGKTAALILGGGSPKNFLLQTEPHIQEVLGLPEAGHDFFVQFTDARIDTGGLSGATPSEAVSWGKIDPTQLSATQVVYGDCSVYIPLFVSYILSAVPKQKPRRLWEKRDECMDRMLKAFKKSKHWGK